MFLGKALRIWKNKTSSQGRLSLLQNVRRLVLTVHKNLTQIKIINQKNPRKPNLC